VGECGKEAWDMDWGRLNPDVVGVLEFAPEVERGDRDYPREN
jgi:hypothetical protein